MHPGHVGYCLSGGIALQAAADFPERIVAAASFHGGRLATEAPDSPHLRAAGIRARLYFGYATDDASMPPDAIARLEAALTAAGVVFRGEVYPARHGWAVADSPAYDRDAAERHWTALLDHLAAAFPHRGSRRDDPARVMSGTGKATVRTGKSG